MERASGILQHISSLPSEHGIGDFGPGAYAFADFLKASGQTLWQLLPLNPTDGVYGHSPYSSPSAFAGNPLFISPDELLKEGLLEKKDLADKHNWPADHVEYDKVVAYKRGLFDRAYQRFKASKAKFSDYEKFCAEHNWLENFAVFCAAKRCFHNKVWTRWPEEIKNKDAAALAKFKSEQQEVIEETKFLQFVFWRQWNRLKSYCNKNSIKLIGDIPIYVTHDGADCFSHPELFKLTQNQEPEFVAGVPPDYFSKTGQRWGNPVYDWKKLAQTDYKWWRDRIGHNLRLFDIVRIDHFRGLVAYWEIPAAEKTAINGYWVEVPSDHFFTTLKNKIGSLPVIAEDLGIITPDVTQVMERFGFSGMKVLLFAFGGELKTHPYIPDNYAPNCVAYTGTHDNNTVRGWFENEASEHEKTNLFVYLKKRPDVGELNWAMMEILMNSRAQYVITPLQDILGLGKEARMNTPSTIQGNWQWRVLLQSLTPVIVRRLRQLTENSSRSLRLTRV